MADSVAFASVSAFVLGPYEHWKCTRRQNGAGSQNGWPRLQQRLDHLLHLVRRFRAADQHRHQEVVTSCFLHSHHSCLGYHHDSDGCCPEQSRPTCLPLVPWYRRGRPVPRCQLLSLVRFYSRLKESVALTSVQLLVQTPRARFPCCSLLLGCRACRLLWWSLSRGHNPDERYCGLRGMAMDL